MSRLKITNETFMHCHQCGVEANGLQAINRVFGYKIVNDDITPYSICRECRKKTEPLAKEKERWTTAASWGREINISRKKFDNYLVDLGYLDCEESDKHRKGKLYVTEKGKQHSAITNAPFGKKILWDFDTFANVVKMRAERCTVYDCCPRCKAHLDSMPNYKHMDYSHKCHRCGLNCEEWYLEVTYDK